MRCLALADTVDLPSFLPRLLAHPSLRGNLARELLHRTRPQHFSDVQDCQADGCYLPQKTSVLGDVQEVLAELFPGAVAHQVNQLLR